MPKPTRTVRRRPPVYYFLRVVSVMFAGAVGAWFLFLVMVKVVHPYKLGDAEARKVTDLRKRLAIQEAINTKLQHRVDYLQSEEGAETEARRALFHKPGEIVFFLDENTLRTLEPKEQEPD